MALVDLAINARELIRPTSREHAEGATWSTILEHYRDSFAGQKRARLHDKVEAVLSKEGTKDAALDEAATKELMREICSNLSSNRILLQRRPEEEPLCPAPPELVDAVRSALESVSFASVAELVCAGTSTSLYAIESMHYHGRSDGAPMAMEYLRELGQKAIKKWRHYQGIKRKDEATGSGISGLIQDLYSVGGYALLELQKDGLLADTSPSHEEAVADTSKSSNYPVIVAHSMALYELKRDLREQQNWDDNNNKFVFACSEMKRKTMMASIKIPPMLAKFCLERLGHSRQMTLVELLNLPSLAEDFSAWSDAKEAEILREMDLLVESNRGITKSSSLDFMRLKSNKCPHCASTGVELYSKQTRRSDEPTTFFMRCTSCLKNFVENKDLGWIEG